MEIYTASLSSLILDHSGAVPHEPVVISLAGLPVCAMLRYAGAGIPISKAAVNCQVLPSVTA